MPPFPHGMGRHRLAASIAILAIVVFVASYRPAPAVTDDVVGHDHSSHAGDMSEEAMQAWVDAWFATHPEVGRTPILPQGAPIAAEFLALGTSFNADGNAATLVDTVQIEPGETVQWRRIVGSHTVTSGANSVDPDAGLVFEVSLEPASPVFQFTYMNAGVFPFFCRPHESFEMKGVVVVVDPTPTRSTTWGELKARNRGR